MRQKVFRREVLFDKNGFGLDDPKKVSDWLDSLPFMGWGRVRSVGQGGFHSVYLTSWPLELSGPHVRVSCSTGRKFYNFPYFFPLFRVTLLCLFISLCLYLPYNFNILVLRFLWHQLYNSWDFLFMCCTYLSTRYTPLSIFKITSWFFFTISTFLL